MIGKADVADAALGLAAGDPLFDAQALQLFPLREVGEHVHQVIVDTVGAQAAQLLAEGAVDGFGRAHHVLGQLGGDIHLVAALVLRQDPAQAVLAAGVDIGGVEIVDAQLHAAHDLGLRLGEVDAAALFAEAHAAVAQLGYLPAVFI